MYDLRRIQTWVNGNFSSWGQLRLSLWTLLPVSVCLIAPPAEAVIIHVNGPGESIQAAIDISNDGDVILLAPGTYVEPIVLNDNFVILASCFYTTQDPACIQNTIIQGVGRLPTDPNVIRIRTAVPDGTRIVGLTLENGADCVHTNAPYEFNNSVARLCGDGLD